jgi:hypothetical protein
VRVDNDGNHLVHDLAHYKLTHFVNVYIYIYIYTYIYMVI